jgi:hypothetical protein
MLLGTTENRDATGLGDRRKVNRLGGSFLIMNSAPTIGGVWSVNSKASLASGPGPCTTRVTQGCPVERAELAACIAEGSRSPWRLDP